MNNPSPIFEVENADSLLLKADAVVSKFQLYAYLKKVVKRVTSEALWKERVITILMTVTYLLGNGIEMMSGKVTDDPPAIWITGILLGVILIWLSLSRYKQYTSYLFKFYLLYLNFNIIYGYGRSTFGDGQSELFYLLFSYVLLVVTSQGLDSRRELQLFTLAELAMFGTIGYLNADGDPIIFQTMHLFTLGFVVAGNYMIHLQRMKLTQVSVDSGVQFKVISDHARDAQIIINTKAQFIYMNPAANLLLGYDNDELVKKPLEVAMLEEDVELIKNTIEQLAGDEEARIINEYRICTKAGEVVWVESIFSSFKPSMGSKEYLIIAETRNIEARKKHEEEIQKQLKAEELLVKYSNSFITVERNEIQANIDEALRDFGHLLTADAVLVYRIHGRLIDEFRSTNAWFSRSSMVLGDMFNLTVKINQQLVSFLKSLGGGRASRGIFIDPKQLHDIKILDKVDTLDKKIYVVPLSTGAVTNGFVMFVFGSTNKTSQANFFGLVGNMIGNAFTRLKTEIRLHEAQLTNEYILRALPDWLYIVNHKGQFTGSNQYSSLEPYIPDHEVKGKSFEDVLPPQVATLFNNSLLELTKTDSMVSFEYYDDALMTGKYFKAIMAPFKADEYIIILRDITELKKAELELESKAVKLEQSNKELEQFAYIVSHDMKQPIRTIISYLNLVKKKCTGQIPEEGMEFIQYSIEGANKMSALIRDILDYSKIDQQIEIQADVSLSRIYKSVQANLNDIITSNNAEIFCDELPVVCGNETMLTELFQNLIENGMKYNRREKKRIDVRVTEQEQHWHFAISDNGIGFEEEYAHQIFKIFKRLHTDGEFQGTGIGLAVCQKVVEKHGGTIWASSKKDEGSTFHFTLPKQQQMQLAMTG